MAVTISGDTGVSAVQSGVVAQGDLAANVAGNGPAFCAFGTGLVSNNGVVLLQLPEEYDSTNAFSAGVFTPQTPGLYQVSATCQVNSTTVAYVALILKKNGVSVSVSTGAGYVSAWGSASLSALIQMNGTTDSLAIYHDISVTGTPTVTIARTGAFLARAA